MTTTDPPPIPADRVADRVADRRTRTSWLPAPLVAVVDRFLPQGAVLLSILSLGSYAMGLVRDRFQARTFGAGAELDAYNAAFTIPELLFDVFIAAGLVAPFVPIFMKLSAESEQDAERFAHTILTMALLLMAALSAVLLVVAPATVDLVAPSFPPQQRTLYADLFRVMCVTPLLFSISLVLGEILVARRRFLFYGLAPILYNAGIVFGTVVLAGRLGIFGPAVGAVMGTLLHLGIRAVGIAMGRFPIRPALDLRTDAIRTFGRLMLPRMASAPIEPLTFQFFTAVASGMVAGSVSSISFARNFQSVPVSLIGIAFSLAAFPALSSAVANGDRDGFGRILRSNIVSIALLTAFAGAGLFVLSHLIIRVLLGGGAFDAEDVDRTALVLAAFAISVPLESLTYPLARAIYATRNTILPVAASVIGFIAILASTSALAPSAGIVAVPIGFAVGSAVKLVLLAIAVPVRMRRIPALGREALSPSS